MVPLHKHIVVKGFLVIRLVGFNISAQYTYMLIKMLKKHPTELYSNKTQTE